MPPHRVSLCAWAFGVSLIEISGPDAFTLTYMMTPRDLDKCAVRQARYAFITLPDGGIANDPVLMRLEENRFWLSLADSDIGLWASGLAYQAVVDYGHAVSRRRGTR